MGDYGPQWDVQTELLAQMVEEVSVLAADHRRKKPRQIPRPGATTGADGAKGLEVSSADPVQVQQVINEGGTLRGHLALAQAASAASKVRVVGDPAGVAP